MLTQHDTEKLVHVFITSNVDYCKELLPRCLIKEDSDGSGFSRPHPQWGKNQSSLLRLIQATLNVY